MEKKSSSDVTKVAVIGAGIFGSLVAIELAKRGCSVSLYETNAEIMLGASLNNQNRLHLGYHYPRDDNTALQCIKGFERFKSKFPDCILGDFPNHYYIADQGSHVTLSEYYEFCNRVGLPVRPISENFNVNVRNVAGGVSTDEVVYDSRLLSEAVRERLAQSAVSVFCGCEVTGLSKNSSRRFTLMSGNVELGTFDKVINSTYANYNKFNRDLDLETQLLQYEYTLVPIVKWLDEPVGVTIMDGPFMTVLPFGRSGNFLLYHVEHTVIASEVAYNLDELWLSKDTSPASTIDKDARFKQMLEACVEFVPELATAELIGFLEGPRVVFSGRDSTDERPSIVNEIDSDGVFSIFSGKIDHSIWVADNVADLIVKR